MFDNIDSYQIDKNVDGSIHVKIGTLYKKQQSVKKKLNFNENMEIVGVIEEK